MLVRAFDGGATTLADCIGTTRTDLPLTISCTTQIGAYSLHLSVYTPPDLPTQTNAPSSSQPPSQPSQTSTNSVPTSSTPTTSSGTDGLGVGAEVGSILGAIFGAAAIVIAIYYGQRQLKRVHHHSRMYVA